MAQGSVETSPCQLCDAIATDQAPGGEWLFKEDLVAAYRSAANLHVPGWCQLQVIRHAPTWGDLSSEEAAALGAGAQRLAAAILAASGATHIYSYSICENIRHFHLVMGPAPALGDGGMRGAPWLSRVLLRDAEVAQADLADSLFEAVRQELR